MEAEVIKQFLPDLVTAISDSVLSVADQCLAEGLITESTYKKVFESGGTSEDRARTLILAVKNSTETDPLRCFSLFLDILEGILPPVSKVALLTRMRNAISDKALVSVSQPSRNQSFPSSMAISQEFSSKNPLLGKLEESIRQHTFACAEKKSLEVKLKSKSEKIEKLRDELRDLKSNDLSLAKDKISVCETEIVELKRRIEMLESTIEEKGMSVKRGKSTINMQLRKFLELVEDEKQDLERSLDKKKAELMKTVEQHEAKLKEKEQALADIQDKHENTIKLKDLEHQVALQKKDMEIKDLKLEHQQLLTSSDGGKTGQSSQAIKDTDYLSEHDDDDDRDSIPFYDEEDSPTRSDELYHYGDEDYDRW